MGTGDAVRREADWLATSGDGLPDLLAGVGGPFDIVQPWWPRTPATQKRGVYVLLDPNAVGIHDERTANIRRMPTYTFLLRIIWPITTGTGSAETEQQRLADAVDLLLKRIDGPMMDKTHGGRFLSVAENPRYVDVRFADPEQTIPAKHLRAEVTYSADDFEINN
jgi:hypothetical protein